MSDTDKAFLHWKSIDVDKLRAEVAELNAKLDKETKLHVHFEAVAMVAIEENEKLEAELESLRDFCQSEIRKLPPDYVKAKTKEVKQ